jgi:2'-5' RNA ligase
MFPAKQRLFIALLPPLEIQQVANQIKQHFAATYNSCAALKSPPHITLQPPFEWRSQTLSVLEQGIETFAQTRGPISITLDGFAAFPPRVIFINVLKTPEFLGLQQALRSYLESSFGIIHPSSKLRPFTPHLTLAFRDLTPQNFDRAWSAFAAKKLYFDFFVFQLTLLSHTGKRWDIQKEFPLKDINCP